MPNYHMMIGMPASGKSTITDKLNTFNTRIVSSDNIIDGIAKASESTYNEMFPHAIDFAHKMCGTLTKAHVKAGKDIISDQTNLSKKTRANKLALIPKHYTKIAHVIAAPPKEEHERRLNSREGKNIPEKVMNDMKTSYESPSHEEGFHEIHHYDHTGKLLKSTRIFHTNHK